MVHDSLAQPSARRPQALPSAPQTRALPRPGVRAIGSWAGSLLLAASLHPTAHAQGRGLKPRPGPLQVTLGDNVARLNLPRGYVLYDKEDTARLVSHGGTKASGDEVGAITENVDSDFAILMRYQAIGHVQDNDAAKLDAEAMLRDFKEGTEAANADRKAAGRPELHVTRWARTPTYDAQRHLITYGLEGTSEGKVFLNCDTQMLGRRGILTVKLITGSKTLEANSKKADAVLGGLTFCTGEQYRDFDPSKDKDSGMGLRELVLGGAGLAVASKLGLLAKLSKVLFWFLLAFKKAGILVVAGIAGLVSKLTGGKSKGSSDSQ